MIFEPQPVCAPRNVSSVIFFPLFSSRFLITRQCGHQIVNILNIFVTKWRKRQKWFLAIMWGYNERGNEDKDQISTRKPIRKSMAMGHVGSNPVGPGQTQTFRLLPDYLGFKGHISTNRTWNLFTSMGLVGCCARP